MKIAKRNETKISALKQFFSGNLVIFYDFLYALFNAVLGFHDGSFWFVSMAAWYLVIGILKLFLKYQKERNEYHRLYKTSGIGIISLAIILSGIICMGISENRNPTRHMIVMIAIAFYTFSLLTYAILSSIRANRTKDKYGIIEKDISMISAIASMLSLERGMLGTFGDPKEQFTLYMEASSGMAAFLVVLFIGIKMLKQASKKDRESSLQ